METSAVTTQQPDLEQGWQQIAAAIDQFLLELDRSQQEPLNRDGTGQNQAEGSYGSIKIKSQLYTYVVCAKNLFYIIIIIIIN